MAGDALRESLQALSEDAEDYWVPARVSLQVAAASWIALSLCLLVDGGWNETRPHRQPPTPDRPKQSLTATHNPHK